MLWLIGWLVGVGFFWCLVAVNPPERESYE